MKCWVCGSDKNKFLWGKEFNNELISSDFAITNGKVRAPAVEKKKRNQTPCIKCFSTVEV